MAPWGDERGQPVQIGFILIFAVLVLSFSYYQAVLVPQQNAEVEFNHFQEVERDMTELRSDLLDAVGSNDSRSVSVDLGTTYPARVLALNPGPPSGTLRTTDPGTVGTNLSASAADLCAAGATTVRSRSLVYTPSYSAYDAARNVTYENTFVARSFRDGARYGNQSFAKPAGGSGRHRIDLRLLTNSYSESGSGSVALDLQPSRTNETDFSRNTPFHVTVPSRFSPSTWETEILVDASSIVRNVEDADTGGVQRVRVVFEPGDYTVSCSAIGLNAQPAYQPPAPPSSGNGGDAAYTTKWLSPAGQTGTSNCDADDCTLDAGQSSTLDLTADTVPTADGATVEFAVNDTGVATVVPTSDTTDSNGEASTTLTARSSGTVKVYAASGGSGDVINVTITSDPGPGLPAEITYVDAQGRDSGELQSVDSTGTQTTYTTTLSVSSVGPKEEDIDGFDAALEVPYVNGNSDLKIIDDADTQEVLENGGVPPTPAATRLGVGNVDGDATTEVVFIDGDSHLRQVDVSDTSSSLIQDGAGNNIDAANVVGVVDFNQDGDSDVVFVGSANNEIRFLDDGTVTTTGVSVADSAGIGQPADLDDDGDVDVPHVDGNNDLALTDSSGTTTTVALSRNAATTSLATIEDRTGNNVPEVGYIDVDNNNIRIVDAVDGTERRAAGNEKARVGPGVS